uniref:Transmembrane protein 107 n=1 Tax=Hanusia phi TaxID=3032 RepID=A0A7S0HWA5_9CRYP|mmetsp:Transcript_4939/g.11672  ORF Transcript_4939/g.11672 Transcript_4939/m.11672 type:complete len:186 (+) Transcript_4939:180-737(+)
MRMAHGRMLLFAAVCLHVAPSAAIASVREDWKYSRWSLDPPHPKNSSCQHLEGESSQSKTLVLTALGGAIGASIRSRLKICSNDIFRQQPWKHILVHAFGALLLGILSHPVVPKETFALFVGALRTVSAIVTVDAYNCVASGNQLLACFYLCTSLPANLIMNHLGRSIASKLQRLASGLADLSDL